jgi:DNA ligase (NAD+)
VPEIGPRIAQSIVSYFADKENLEIINRLKTYSVRLTNEKEAVIAGNTLDGKTIVISGVFEKHSRDEYKELIEQNGGKNATTGSKKTSFILAGENMGQSKKDKATELGVQMINEQDFLKIIGKD